MSALIAALICSDSPGHAFTTISRPGSFGASGASCASDFAPPPSEIGVFDTVTGGCSNPTGPIDVTSDPTCTYESADWANFLALSEIQHLFNILEMVWPCGAKSGSYQERRKKAYDPESFTLCVRA